MSISIARFQDFFLVLTRLLAILSAVPVLGGRAIPMQVRLGLGVLVAIIIFPWSPTLPAADDYQSLIPFLWSIAQELITGILAGMAARFAFTALDAAGRLMAESSGFAAGSVLNPAMDIPGTALDQFYTMMVVLIFLMTNGHHQLLRGVALSFEVVPLRSLALDAAGQENLIRMSANMLLTATQIAMPVMALMLLLDLGLGLMARAAPQMNVFFVGAPLKAGLAFFAVAAVLPALFPIITNLFSRMPYDVIQLIR
ncbi:MAG: flagellar biosynthetic protein FliR [Chloroflexi bacterium]|nr:flagellar biosynthetic protein FliR [Chloroflexota bacterium]